MRAGIGISTGLDPTAAGSEAAERASARLGSQAPDLVVVLASAAHGGGLPEVVRSVRDVLGVPVVGGSVEGIVAPGVEVSSYPAVLVLAVTGCEAAPFFLHEASGEEARAGEEIAARLGRPGPDDLVVLLADSQSVDVGVLARSLPEGLDGATVVGTGAAAAARGRPLLWAGSEMDSNAVSGWILRGARPRVAVTQAGQPVTPALRVTRARGNWILGLEGRPALDVYQEVAEQLGLSVRGESAPPLLVGLSPSKAQSGAPVEASLGASLGAQGAGSDWLVRNVVGLDPDRGGLSVPESMFSGQEVAFVRLDPDAARLDFAERLEGMTAQPAGFGLYLNCQARGASLFGEAGVEAKQLANAFAHCPVAGVTGPFQIAPLASGRAPSVLTYAGVLALVGD